MGEINSVSSNTYNQSIFDGSKETVRVNVNPYEFDRNLTNRLDPQGKIALELFIKRSAYQYETTPKTLKSSIMSAVNFFASKWEMNLYLAVMVGAFYRENSNPNDEPISSKLLGGLSQEQVDDGIQAYIPEIDPDLRNEVCSGVSYISPSFEYYCEMADHDPSVGLAQLNISRAVLAVLCNPQCFPEYIRLLKNFDSFQEKLRQDLTYSPVQHFKLYAGWLKTQIENFQNHLPNWRQLTSRQQVILLISSIDVLSKEFRKPGETRFDAWKAIIRDIIENHRQLELKPSMDGFGMSMPDPYLVSRGSAMIFGQRPVESLYIPDPEQTGVSGSRWLATANPILDALDLYISKPMNPEIIISPEENARILVDAGVVKSDDIALNPAPLGPHDIFKFHHISDMCINLEEPEQDIPIHEIVLVGGDSPETSQYISGSDLCQMLKPIDDKNEITRILVNGVVTLDAMLKPGPYSDSGISICRPSNIEITGISENSVLQIQQDRLRDNYLGGLKFSCAWIHDLTIRDITDISPEAMSEHIQTHGLMGEELSLEVYSAIIENASFEGPITIEAQGPFSLINSHFNIGFKYSRGYRDAFNYPGFKNAVSIKTIPIKYSTKKIYQSPLFILRNSFRIAPGTYPPEKYLRIWGSGTPQIKGNDFYDTDSFKLLKGVTLEGSKIEMLQGFIGNRFF